MTKPRHSTYRLLALDPARGQQHRDPGPVGHEYCELKHGLGLDHFEGRHWLGWHHHTTLVTAAHLFATEQRLATAGPKAREAG